jgi:hypothetical protein
METFQGNEYFRRTFATMEEVKNVQKVYLINRSIGLRESSKFEAKLKDKITALVSKHSFMKF